MEVVNGVMNSMKPREEGNNNMAVDPKKLAATFAPLAGRIVMGRVMAARQRKTKQMDEALALLRERAGIKTKKKGPAGRILFLLGLALGAIGYIATLKPEQREQFFKGVDKLVNDISGLINEFQGKPYTKDYEKSRA
jgi:hypothetical protein